MHRSGSSPRLSLLMLLAGLAACGGGGDAPAPSPSQSPPPAPTPAPANAVASTCGLPDFAAAALARINQWRASGATCGTRGAFAPAPALAWNPLLTQAAERHSQDMAGHDLFSHTGSDGSTLGVRVSATGYAWSSLGENIAAGQRSVASVVDGWIASEGHCVNLLNPAYREFGLSCVSGSAADTYPTYWTLDLGQPR